MALLAEYAITPEVFDLASYGSEEVCGLHLDRLRESLMEEAIIRDLRDGGWSQACVRDGTQWHRRTKELLKKLSRDGRLIRFQPVLQSAPVTAGDWCKEALAGRSTPDLAGIVTTREASGEFPQEPLVAAIERLSASAWWQARSPSVRLPRTIASYVGALAGFLRHANSLMFIDPHVDPSRSGYTRFGQLLRAIGQRSPAPTIEIHRVCYHGSGQHRQILQPTDIEKSFRKYVAPDLAAVGLSAEVFVWDDFHHRCLIANLAGVLLENGFDESGAPDASTIWSRLGRDVRDDVQREFEPSSNRHALRYRFTI